MNTLKITWSLVLAGAVVTAACGDSKSSMNPVAPSAVVIGAQSEEAGDPGAVSDATGKATTSRRTATAMGTATGNGNGRQWERQWQRKRQSADRAVGAAAARRQHPQPPGLKKVEIEGLISVKGGNTIVVNGQIVVVPADLPDSPRFDAVHVCRSARRRPRAREGVAHDRGRGPDAR